MESSSPTPPGSTLEEGETLVFRPLGNSRFRLVGRIARDEWNGDPRPAAAHALRVTEYAVPAGSGPHDVAPARRRTVWYTAQAAGSSAARPGDRQGDGGRARRRLRAARRHRRAGRRAVGDRRRPQRDRARRPGTLAVKRYPLPASSGYANLNTGDVRPARRLWFTGQSGIYGRLDPRSGALRVFRAPGGLGPYGIATTPAGQVWYASLAGSHIARIDLDTGKATVVRPPTAGQGARRIWSDSHGRLWVSEWNAGRVARYDPKTRRWREWRLPGRRPAVRRLRRRPRHRLADRLRRRARSCDSIRRRSASRGSAYARRERAAATRPARRGLGRRVRRRPARVHLVALAEGFQNLGSHLSSPAVFWKHRWMVFPSSIWDSSALLRATASPVVAPTFATSGEPCT